MRRRAWVWVEVVSAFCVVRLGFRALKTFSGVGRWEAETGHNFTPGCVMLAVTLSLVWLARRRPGGGAVRPWGLTVPGREAIFGPFAVSVACFLVGAAVAVACGLRPARGVATAGEAALHVLGNGVTAGVFVLLGWRMWARAAAGRRRRIAAIFAVLFLALCVALPVRVAVASDGSIAHAAGTVMWIVFASALGEEVFFRGYVQGRLDEVYGTPWTWCGIRLGPGLLGAAVLFGLIHVFNPMDEFRGTWGMAPWHGIATASTWIFGLLRAATGSVLPGTVLHAAVNLAPRVVG